MKKYNTERRKLLINKNFQIRFIWTMLIPVFFFAVIIFLTSLFTIWPIVQKDIEAWNNKSSEIKHALIETYNIAKYDTSNVTARKEKLDKLVPLKNLLWDQPDISVHKYIVNTTLILLANFIVVLIIVSIMAFRISHRLMGPVPRFKQVMDAIGEGDLTKRANFRDKDEFKALLENDFNIMVQSISERISAMKERINTLSNLTKNKNSISPEDWEIIQKEVEALQNKINTFKTKA